MLRNKAILLALASIFVCGFIHGQSISQQKDRKQRIEKDIEILRKQLSSNESKAEQAISSITLLQAQQSARGKLIKESDAEISTMDRQIGVIQNELHKKQAALDTLEKHYSRLVAGAYKNRDVKLWFMYILASENLSQAYRRFGYFKNLSAQIRSQAERVEEAKEELNRKKSELQGARKQAQALRDQRQKELNQLKADETKQQKLVAKLKKDNKSVQASLRSKQAEIRAIDRMIEKMLAEASGSGTTSGKKKAAKPIDLTLDKDFEKNMGKLPWPVEGPVTEHFGTYRNKELKITLNNNGINIACDADSPVRSVFDGVVCNVMVAPGYGQCILVQHGSYYTTYCKVKNATVRQGDKVKTGQILGEVATIMGKTQLNFLIYKKKYLDPEQWLRDR